MSVGLEGEHRVVGHALDPARAFRAPRLAILLTRVAHEHLEVHGGGDFREVVGDLGGADDEHAPARPVHAHEALGGALAFVVGLGRGQRPRAGGQLDLPRHDAPGADRGEQRLEVRRRDLGLDDHIELAAARQPEAPRLLGAHAIGGELRRASAIFRAARDEIVLDASTRDRADEDAVVADRGERSRRPRARAESLRHGEQPDAAPASAPLERAFQNIEIKALHE